jgi:hypothetical protein
MEGRDNVVSGRVRIWNPVAIDYSAGVDIYDPITGIVYTDEEAKMQQKDVRSRLLLRGRKIGCWVDVT